MSESATSAYRIALNAHLLSGEASYRSAGIHGYLFNTLAHLPEVDAVFAYTVFTGPGRAAPHPALDVRRSRLDTSNPLKRIVWEQAALPLTLARTRPLLHHGMAFALPAAWRGPSVVTIFDLSFLRYPDRLSAARRVYLRWATQYAARRAQRVITISESSKAEIAALLGTPPDRIDVAPPGVGEEFTPHPPEAVEAFRRANGLPERFILYLGTLEPRKNLPTLLRAYAGLPQRGAVKLVLAGARGWGLGEIEALIEQLDLDEDVILPGFIAGSDLPMWYNSAQIFAYPSAYEGFGMPVVEAMACGVPVVASAASSLPEAAGDAGRLVPPDDVEAWQGALAELLDDPAEREAMAARGIEQAKRFTWRRTAQQTVAAYRRALNLSQRGTQRT